MLQRRLDGGLGAISLARLHSYLDAAGVGFHSAKDQEQLPPALVRELESTIPNTRTLWQIEDALIDRLDGYLVLTGHPGAGKTLITASFQPTDTRICYVARYFPGGYIGSELPPAHYRNLATFAQWLSSEASLRSRQAIAVRSDSTVGELAESIVDNLKAIAATFTSDQLGVLFIDGVDAAASETSPTFLDYLPSTSPEGLAIVVTTTDGTALVNRCSHLRIASTLDTHSLPLYDCEHIVLKRLGDSLLPSQAALVAELSQGHPLTLSYFINELRTAQEHGVNDPLSVLEGGPTDYYRRVWNRLAEKPPAQYLLAIIASLRGTVSEEELFRMVPAEQKADFIGCFSNIRHLLRVEDNAIQFYHESFRDFVHTNTSIWHQRIHATIAAYCASPTDSQYTLTNLLYHHLKMSDDGRNASQLCKQDWLDRAASSCVQPELLLSDIEELLNDRLQAGDLAETFRLLLLRSRIHYRYNHVFAMFAAHFAKATIGLRDAAQSLRFIVRDEHYMCTIEDALSMGATPFCRRRFPCVLRVN